MIEKIDKGFYELQCDNCGDTADERFSTFNEAVEFKKDKDNGWQAVKSDSEEWYDLCPSCRDPATIRKIKLS